MNLIGTKEIETERLILRRLRIEDAEKAYLNWCSSDNVSKYVTWNKHKDVEETKELFNIWSKEYEKNDTFRWIVEVKENHEVIGTIDVVKKDTKAMVAEIGYCYSEKYWNKGYATEALIAILKYCFIDIGFELVYARHMSLNPASGKVMEKAGLKYEATLKGRMLDKDNNRNDLIYYSLTKDEYLK